MLNNWAVSSWLTNVTTLSTHIYWVLNTTFPMFCKKGHRAALFISWCILAGWRWLSLRGRVGAKKRPLLSPLLLDRGRGRATADKSEAFVWMWDGDEFQECRCFHTTDPCWFCELFVKDSHSGGVFSSEVKQAESMFITPPVLPQLLRYFQIALFEKRLLNLRITI